MANDGVAAPTLLQPRVAVVLGVPDRWHPPLFACRLPSVVPAVWWSLPIAIRLVLQLHALVVARDGDRLSFESRLRLTETGLAMIWVCCRAQSRLASSADEPWCAVWSLGLFVLLLHRLSYV